MLMCVLLNRQVLRRAVDDHSGHLAVEQADANERVRVLIPCLEVHAVSKRVVFSRALQDCTRGLGAPRPQPEAVTDRE